MNLNRLAYFAAVVDAGSFTRAAERLGITKAVVSQQVARLERDVGTTLLIRTTRRVHPAEAGRTFHARCLQVLQQAEDAFDELAQAAAEPTGTLRIAAPNDYGTSAVVPVVAAFSTRYAACRVELTLGDDTIDLASGGMDVAIRVGWLADSSLQARRIGTFRQFMVCGAGFAGRFQAGEPQDLAGLPFVANMALREPLLWQFSRGDAEQTVRMQATIAIDATPAVLAAVRAGAGLSVLPDFLVRDELATGRLVQVLPEWQLPSGGIYTVYPAARFRPPKVTRFVEILVAAEQNVASGGQGRRG
ncbi:MAG: LysR family transcriptional regulator [Mesorhizobium sp.]|uniref:LysR family transcriptional regulator n=1 Tax=Mesorhizobium sp. TaxID=1871066 RepID=UPI000FEA17D7|nr:LysR family transcriptional regulator [Mesorhizobium sp.]RWO25704.1 MAG: LysR family transcriptional regulator [Mesorhizobium sp.]